MLLEKSIKLLKTVSELLNKLTIFSEKEIYRLCSVFFLRFIRSLASNKQSKSKKTR